MYTSNQGRIQDYTFCGTRMKKGTIFIEKEKKIANISCIVLKSIISLHIGKRLNYGGRIMDEYSFDMSYI